MRVSPLAFRALNGTLLAAHAALLLAGSFQNFVVVDEAAHIPAGIAHWRTGDFSAYRVNPPLARMVATLPALLFNPVTGSPTPEVMEMERPEWLMAIAFQKANWDNYLSIARLARLPGIVISLLGAWLVGRWARERSGEFAATIAIAIWAFEPTIIAFGQVVTADVPAAVAGVAACYIFRSFLKRPSWSTALLAGCLLGVAQATKFTLLLLYPIWLIVAWSALASQNTRSRKRTFTARFAALLALSLLGINAAYGFRGSFEPLGSLPLSSRFLAGGSETSAQTNRFSQTWFASLPVPLPADYIIGIDLQQRDFESGLPSYLQGEWRHRGWWYYYLYAMAIKTPLGTLALILVGFLRTLWRGVVHPCSDDWLLLAPAIAIVALVSAQTGFNHHFRYLLPAFPFLILLASTVCTAPSGKQRAFKAVILLLVAWSALSVVRIHPHEMSYFNEAVGGPEHGDQHLVDSNIDWGQDLLFLAEWARAHPEARPLHLAYYHFLDPRMVGLEFTLPPRGPTGIFPIDKTYQSRFGPKPGYYAVSINHLRGSRFVAPDGHGGLYHAIRGDFEYFQSLKPTLRAGYSIRIYHVR
jgi:hypothetical protein